jgi:hypothetical protein
VQGKIGVFLQQASCNSGKIHKSFAPSAITDVDRTVKKQTKTGYHPTGHFSEFIDD